MLLTVLGCWAPYPAAGGACSSYLIQNKEQLVLLDCGHGSFSWLQKVTDFRRLDAIIISHLHPDHYADLFCLRHALAGAKREGRLSQPVALFIPQELPPELGPPFNYQDVFDIKAIESYLDKEQGTIQTKLGPCRLAFQRTAHPVLTYAISLETGEGNNLKKLVYSADTGWTPDLVKFCNSVDLFICESSFQEKVSSQVNLGHMTVQEAARLAKAAQVRRLILTHFWPEFDLQEHLRLAKEVFPGPVHLAREGLSFYI